MSDQVIQLFLDRTYLPDTIINVIICYFVQDYKVSIKDYDIHPYPPNLNGDWLITLSLTNDTLEFITGILLVLRLKSGLGLELTKSLTIEPDPLLFLTDDDRDLLNYYLQDNDVGEQLYFFDDESIFEKSYIIQYCAFSSMNPDNVYVNVEAYEPCSAAMIHLNHNRTEVVKGILWTCNILKNKVEIYDRGIYSMEENNETK